MEAQREAMTTWSSHAVIKLARGSNDEPGRRRCVRNRQQRSTETNTKAARNRGYLVQQGDTLNEVLPPNILKTLMSQPWRSSND